MRRFVLDTSAILSVLFEEDGADRVEELLSGKDSDVFVPFIALMEAEYRLLRVMSRDEVEGVLLMVESWPVQVQESTPEWRRQAASVKAQGGLSVADSWVAALAILTDGELVHKDPEFDGVEGLKAVRLPYHQAT